MLGRKLVVSMYVYKSNVILFVILYKILHFINIYILVIRKILLGTNISRGLATFHVLPWGSLMVPSPLNTLQGSAWPRGETQACDREGYFGEQCLRIPPVPHWDPGSKDRHLPS